MNYKDGHCKLNLRPLCKKVANPSHTWSFSTNMLGLLTNCSTTEGCAWIKMNPVNLKDTLYLWGCMGKELLRCMGLPIRTGDTKEAITKCMVRDVNTMTGLECRTGGRGCYAFEYPKILSSVQVQDFQVSSIHRVLLLLRRVYLMNRANVQKVSK